MGWEEYRKSVGKKHYFKKQNCPDFWVELRLFESLPYGRTKSLLMGEPKNPDEAREMQKEADKLLKEVVLAWNIPDPNGEDPLVPMPLPSEDISVLDKLPTDFVAQIHDWLKEDSKLAKRAGAVPSRSSRG